MTTTQASLILDHLKSGAKITALEALEKFQCFRLASRISQLKKEGHPIDSKMIQLPNGKHIAEYSINQSVNQ